VNTPSITFLSGVSWPSLAEMGCFQQLAGPDQFCGLCHAARVFEGHWVLSSLWGSENPVGQGGFDVTADLRSAEYVQRCNRRSRKCKRVVGRNHGQPKHTNIQNLSSRLGCDQLCLGDVAQPKIRAFAGHRLPHRLCVTFDLISDWGSNEIGSVGIEPLLHRRRGLDRSGQPCAGCVQSDRGLCRSRRADPDYKSVPQVHLKRV
jgi:hypothetical protein